MKALNTDQYIDRMDLTSLTWYNSPPELDIDPALAQRSLSLQPQVVHRGGGRQTVERHVHQGRVRCHFLVLRESPCSRPVRDVRAGENSEYDVQKPDRLCTSSESRTWLQVRDTELRSGWVSD